VEVQVEPVAEHDLARVRGVGRGAVGLELDLPAVGAAAVDGDGAVDRQGAGVVARGGRDGVPTANDPAGVDDDRLPASGVRCHGPDAGERGPLADHDVPGHGTRGADGPADDERAALDQRVAGVRVRAGQFQDAGPGLEQVAGDGAGNHAV